MPQSKTAAVILAAGKGTRMKSDYPKVLHPLLGKPLVSYVVDACRKAKADRTLLVVGYRSDLVREKLGPGLEYVEQTEQLGTGHALMTAAESLKKFKGNLLVLVGDAPFLTGQVLKKMIARQEKTGASAVMMTAVIDPPPAYGRIIRGEDGRVLRIVEERDATPAEKKITEVNTSHYCFRAEHVLPLLNELSTNNDQGEYYLTDVVELLNRRGKRVEALTISDPDILKGINSRKQLSDAGRVLQWRILNDLFEKGVSIPDPRNVYIEPDVKVGKDTTIMPFTSLTGSTVIGKNCIIGPNVRLSNTTISDGCRIEFAVVDNYKFPKNDIIGPFAFLEEK